MDKTTAEIIMVCKGKHDLGEFDALKQSIAHYMADRCAYPVELYTEAMINQIIWDAALDYIDSFQEYRASSFLREIHRIMELHNNPISPLNRIDMYEAACIAFQLAQIRNKNGYINGFTEENTGFVYKSSTKSTAE